MPDRHLVITGASAGIGRAIVGGLTGPFDRMTLIGRNPAKHTPVQHDLRSSGVETALIECELGSLASVSDAAAAIDGPIDVLVANAGVAGRRGVTVDGFELAFGVNHLAHHLLVTEVTDRITDRVVVVSSNAHHDAEGFSFDGVIGRTRSPTGIPEYRRSKLANVWFGRALARRSAFAVHIVHPGMTATAIWRRLPWPIRPLMLRRMLTPEEGAATPVWAATADGLETGGYFSRCRQTTPSSLALDDAAAEDLWHRSEEWVAPFRRSA